MMEIETTGVPQLLNNELAYVFDTQINGNDKISNGFNFI